MEKKGFEMIWNTFVVIVLALILLIAVVLFFTGNFKGFVDNTKGYFSSSNVDATIKSCNLLINSGNDYSFCCDKQDVKYILNGEKAENSFSCNDLINESFINGKINNNIKCSEVKC